MEDVATQLEEMEQEEKKVIEVTTQFWGSVVHDKKLEQLTTQLQEAKGQLETLETSLRALPPDFQITKSTQLKELHQHVVKERECQERHSTQLDDFQDIGVQLLIKAVSDKKDVTDKIVEHPLAHDLTGSREIAEKVKDITQQYEDFKQKINGYTMSS